MTFIFFNDLLTAWSRLRYCFRVCHGIVANYATRKGYLVTVSAILMIASSSSFVTTNQLSTIATFDNVIQY